MRGVTLSSNSSTKGCTFVSGLPSAASAVRRSERDQSTTGRAEIRICLGSTSCCVRRPFLSRVQAAADTSTSGASEERVDGNDEESSRRREEALQEYAMLKKQLVRDTTIAGVCLSVYFLLVWSKSAAFGAALGGTGSYFYLKMMQEEVDSLSLDYVPIVTLPMERIRKKLPPEKTFSQVERETNEYLKAKMQVSGPLKQAIKPRMLIPVALGATAGGIHLLFGEDVLPFSAILLGFFSYKLSLVVQIWNQLKVLLVPKFDVDEYLRKYEQ